MLRLLNAYFAYGKTPAQTVRALVQERRFSAALAGYAAAALCSVIFFCIGAKLTVWGLLGCFVLFWVFELTMGYLWASLSGLFLNFFSAGNGPSALFVVLGLSGFVNGLLLCFALPSLALPWLEKLRALTLLLVAALRLAFVVRNVSRAAQISVGKAIGALCFAMVPVAAGLFFLMSAALLLFVIVF